jgi:uncharacterized membrane protein
MIESLGRILEWMVRNHRTLTWVMFAVMALLVVLDLLVPAAYDRFVWEGIGGFGAFYGFVSCVLIIVVSKILGYKLLYRQEDYFDDELSGREMSGKPDTGEARADD